MKRLLDIIGALFCLLILCPFLLLIAIGIKIDSKGPVISTSLPAGVPYVNKHGVSGLIVPPGDVDALAAAMKRLLKNGEERERMGKDALERFNREFTSRLMGERVLNIYKEVIHSFSSKRLSISL